MGLRPRKSTKNPPIFSHEFVIQNHADIVSCVAMVFIVGLMFQATSPVATLFITMQYNVTLDQEGKPVEPDANQGADLLYMYTYGLRDVFAVFFYCLIGIVVHAIIQEYILDKVNRKMHLSKVKHSKFNESGQLLFFYLASAALGIDIIIRENLLTAVNSLWENYPESHAVMPFTVKFFFVVQIAYWLHTFPELYFQKVKKEEMMARVQYACLYLVFITFAYLFNFTRVAMCLLIAHYIAEFIYHGARLLYFSDKPQFAHYCFKAWNTSFVLVRLASITTAVLTYWYGLAKNSSNTMNIAEGNFNTQLIRINCLAAICLLQAWMMLKFITFHLKRNREHVANLTTTKKLQQAQMQKRKDRRAKGQDSSSETSPPGTPKNQVENGSAKRSVRNRKAH